MPIYFHNCRYKVYSKGCKIPKDPHYPCSSWGSYLPGDEPGYYCELDDEECNIENTMKLEDCPRMEKTHIKLAIDVNSYNLWKDIETKEYYCIEENLWFTIDDIRYEIIRAF